MQRIEKRLEINKNGITKYQEYANEINYNFKIKR